MYYMPLIFKNKINIVSNKFITSNFIFSLIFTFMSPSSSWNKCLETLINDLLNTMQSKIFLNDLKQCSRTLIEIDVMNHKLYFCVWN